MLIYDKLLQAFTHITEEGTNTAKLRKAWDLLQQQAIHAVSALEHDYIKGFVTDVQKHSVVLDVNDFKASSCTCEGGIFCSHMAALFFSYSTKLANGKVLAQQAYFQLLGVVNASSKATEMSREANNSSSLTMNRIFDVYEKDYSEDWKKCKHSFHPLSQTLTHLKGLAKDKPYEQQRYFWCAAILYAISLGERSVQAVDSFSRYYYEMSYKRIIEPWVSQLQDIMNNVEVQLSWSDEEIEALYVLFNFSIDQVEKYAKTTFEWDYFAYRLVKIIYRSELYKDKIDSQIKRLVSDAQQHNVRSVGYGLQAMIYITNQEDAKAIASIKQAHFDKVQRIIYPVVERRMTMNNWDAVSEWMDYLADHFAESTNFKSVGPFLNLCQKATQAQRGEKKWSNYLVRYLPHSYAVLSDSFLHIKDYQAWANLQLYMGRKPEDFKGKELLQVEKVKPIVLLPMYHQAIDQLVESRNRQSYRMAVKHLKKLKLMYIEMDKEASWDSFIKQLQHKFARLRAFQEELSKGKVM